ncbi:YodC family protein [Spirosoma pomorum]
MSKFNLGDLVQLKSGGPAMTIGSCKTDFVEQGSLEKVGQIWTCQWFDGNTLSKGDFHEDTIQSVDESSDFLF